MKKNKYIMIIILIITLFSFNNEVYAAQELTCLYENGLLSDKVLLVQYSNGERQIFKNAKNAKITDTGWYRAKASTDNWDKNVKKDSEGNLTACPGSKKTSGNRKGTITFYGNNDTGNCVLEESYDKIVQPTIYESVSEQGNFGDRACDNISINDKWQSYDKSKFVTACLYQSDVSTNDKSGCHIIQLNISKNGDFEVKQIEPIDKLTNEIGIELPVLTDLKTEEKTLNLDTIKGSYNGDCPIGIYVERKLNPSTIFDAVGNSYAKSYTISTKISTNKNLVGKFSEYNRVGVKGKNLLTGEEQENDVNIDLNFEKITISNCEDLFGEDSTLIHLLKWGITLVKIMIPLIMVGMGVVDFVQAIFAGNEEKMKKAQTKFIKRIIIGVIIFLIPSLLKLILTLANGIWGNIKTDLCGLL